MSLFVCEHAADDTVRLSCNESKVIHILSAMYGRKEKDPGDCPCCMGWFDRCDTNCEKPDSLRRVKDRCEGLSSCHFKADNDFFDDPCPRTCKYVQLAYECDFKVGMYFMISLFNSNILSYLK